MKRKVICTLLVVLFVGLAALFSGCTSSEPDEQVAEAPEQAADQIELQGDYAIDITNLGMALQFYLRINEDNTFVLSADRGFSDDRGSGTIGDLDDTYLMIYSDSTQESSKTATFERDGHNLVFQSTLPYGSTNIMFESEDEDNPEIVHRLMAHKYVYEEYYDTYLGFASADGIEYEYVLNLTPGALYTLTSYQIGEEVPVYQENGSFAVVDQTVVITPQDEDELLGLLTNEGALELKLKPTETAERVDTLLRIASTAEHAGSWYAPGATLELDYFGGYLFTAQDLTEQGIFEVDQETISFSAEGDELTLGTKAPYTLEASFADQEWTFYNEAIQGQFSGGTMVNEAYLASLDLRTDGSYVLEIIDQENDVELANEVGGFSIQAGPMSYLISLDSQGQIHVGDIWPTGLNMTLTIDGTDYSFLLTQ